jgi:hypothetical protein
MEQHLICALRYVPQVAVEPSSAWRFTLNEECSLNNAFHSPFHRISPRITRSAIVDHPTCSRVSEVSGLGYADPGIPTARLRFTSRATSLERLPKLSPLGQVNPSLVEDPLVWGSHPPQSGVMLSAA